METIVPCSFKPFEFLVCYFFGDWTFQSLGRHGARDTMSITIEAYLQTYVTGIFIQSPKGRNQIALDYGTSGFFPGAD